MSIRAIARTWVLSGITCFAVTCKVGFSALPREELKSQAALTLPCFKTRQGSKKSGRRGFFGLSTNVQNQNSSTEVKSFLTGMSFGLKKGLTAPSFATFFHLADLKVSHVDPSLGYF